MSLVFKKERFVDIMPELPALFVAHDQEVHGEPEALPLNPDWRGYAVSEERGVLHIVTARAEGKLVGYVFCFISKSLQTSQRVSAVDLLYLTPEHRKGRNGENLMDEAEKMSRALGAKKIYYFEHGTDRLGPLFIRHGAKRTETVYAMLLMEKPDG